MKRELIKERLKTFFSDGTKIEISISSEEEMILLGEEFSKFLSKCETILMKGEAGAGKTHFTKGIAKGLGILERVLSPTFALVNSYHSEKLDLNFFHFDMYRITNEEEFFEAGLFDLIFEDGIKVIEWSENIEDFVELKKFIIVHILYEDGVNLRKVIIK